MSNSLAVLSFFFMIMFMLSMRVSIYVFVFSVRSDSQSLQSFAWEFPQPDRLY